MDPIVAKSGKRASWNQSSSGGAEGGPSLKERAHKGTGIKFAGFYPWFLYNDYKQIELRLAELSDSARYGS